MLILFGTLSAIIVGAGSFMYVVIMGPSRYHRNGIVGSIYRWLRRLPVALIGACCSIGMRCNQRAGRAKSEVCLNHVLHERHWYMVVFYAVLVLPVEYLYLIHALPELEASLLSKATSWALVLVSEALFVAAVVSDPGTVTTTPTSSTSSDAASSPSRKVGDRKGGRRAAKTSSSAARPGSRFTEEEEYVLNRRYAVDGMLYALANPKERDGVVQEQDELTCSWRRSREAGVGVACYTCHQRKPSRSKHCQLCGRCVRRFDHHCPWINNDVAEGNYRYFLGFLFTHAISCTWAMWDLFAGIRQFFVAKNAWHWRILLSNGSTYPLGISEYLMLFLNFQMRNSLLFIFAFFIGLVLYGFWTYSMTFAVANLTVNDMIKIDEISEFIDGLATPEVVFREATKIRTRLEQVAERPPVALLKLVPPPVVEAGDATAELQVAKYRKSVRKMVVADLKHLFDRGTWNNLMEILFPYAIITRTNLAEVRRVKSKG